MSKLTELLLLGYLMVGAVIATLAVLGTPRSLGRGPRWRTVLVIVLEWPWFAWVWIQEYRSWRRERERLRLEDIVEDLKERESPNPLSEDDS